MVSNIFSTLVTASLFLDSMTKSVLKRRFASTDEVIAKVTTLIEVLKNGFQE
jgi:hypothetical protein